MNLTTSYMILFIYVY